MSDDNKWSKLDAPPPPLFLGEKERNLVKQVNDEVIERVERNQVITLSKNYDFLQYNRLIHEGEETDLTLITMNLTSMSNPNSGTTPSIDFISITLSLAIISTIRRKK